MIARLLLVLAHAAYLLPTGHAAFSESFEVQINPFSSNIPVVVGTPESGMIDQTLATLIDTGSYNMWVINKDNQVLPPDTKAIWVFRHRESPTFDMSKEQFSADFGAIQISGSLGKDDVKIGDGISLVGEHQQQFGMAKTVPSFAVGQVFKAIDAYIGWDLVDTPPSGMPKSVPMNIKEVYGGVPTISFYFSGGEKVRSVVSFNGQDSAYYEGPLNTHAVVKDNGKYNGWKIKYEKLTVGSNSFPTPGGKPARIITRMDPILVGPKDYIDKINAAIFKSATFTYDNKDYSWPCPPTAPIPDYFKQLPEISITIDGKEYKFASTQYLNIFVKAQKCQSLFVASQTQDVIIGMSFLRVYYTKLDYEGKTVQIGKMVKHPDPPKEKKGAGTQ